MQLFAIDSVYGLLHAMHAVKHKDYTCLECGQSVRLRSGVHRQLHFYHLQPNRVCRLNGKSMQHIMLQYYLQSLLPASEVHLEYRFAEINRIADVVWLPKKIVFEVQCSPITSAEVNSRNADYASLGYQVVWLLHDSRYNQTRMTSAEDTLSSWPHYFTNMNAQGEGTIYDQHAFVVGGMRRERLPPLDVDLRFPKFKNLNWESHLFEGNLPQFFLHRIRQWPFYFKGDHLDCLAEKMGTSLLLKYLNELMILEENWCSQDGRDFLSLSIWEFCKWSYDRWIAAPYRALFRLLLERASK